MFTRRHYLYRLAVGSLMIGLLAHSLQSVRALALSASSAGQEIVITGQRLSGGNIVLHWTGGEGPFLLQGKAQVGDQSWVDLVRTRERSAQLPVSDPVALLRVLDLGASVRSLRVTSLAPSSSVSILNNSGNGFAALSFNQSGGYVPPDTCGAAGPSVYVETVNQSVAIYSKASGTQITRNSLSGFFFTTGGLARADSSSGLSDPVVVYDELIGRFVVGDQDVNFNTHVSTFDIAVSKSSNPQTLTTADWSFYRIVATESGYDADYPGNLGYNGDAVVITLNMFGVAGGGHTQIIAVKASDLLSGIATVYRNDLNDFSIRPTTMHGSVAGDPMWLVTEHGDSHSIDVIKMTGVLSTAASFAYSNIPVAAYSGVVAPKNPNGSTVTGNVDSRIQKAASANGLLVTAHAVSVSASQDVIQWYAVNVGGAPTLAQQGRIDAGPNTYLTYPGIDINPSGAIGVSYMRSGTDNATDYPSMWVTARLPADSAGVMQPAVLVPAGTGQANYTDFASPHRAGDLSGINVDPVDGSFWAANEFANTQATANWGTAVANFNLSAPASASEMSVTVTGPSSVTAGTSATYTIRISNGGPNAATGVVLSDTLPSGSAFASVTQTAGTDAFTFGQSGGTITETASGSIAPGASDTFSLVVNAPSSLAVGANFSDTATVSSSNDSNAGNNSATVSGSIVGAAADMAIISHSASPSSSVNEGDQITYTIQVKNLNTVNSATSVVVKETLNSLLKYVSANSSGVGSISQSGGVVTFNLGTLNPNTTLNLTVTAQAIEDGSAGASASVTTTSADSNTANNMAAAAPTTIAEAPIVVSAPITFSGVKFNNATVATFTHAAGLEPASAFSASINWGDGAASSGSITQSGTTYTVQGSHKYTGNGTRKITTTVVEIGNAAELLLIKVGDEDPDLPGQRNGRYNHLLPAQALDAPGLQ